MRDRKELAEWVLLICSIITSISLAIALVLAVYGQVNQ